jgi:hypothetical protein
MLVPTPSIEALSVSKFIRNRTLIAMLESISDPYKVGQNNRSNII